MTNPYDVIIDGKGYIIKEGTYVAAKRPVAADQFRTGDVSYENLSDQQAWAQSDWRGGFNQVLDADRSKFLYSENLDFPTSDGAFKVTNKFSAMFADSGSNVRVDPNAAVKTRFSKYSTTNDWFIAGNSTLSYQQSDASFSVIANLSGVIVDTISTADKLYVSVADHDILWASSNPTAAASWTAELSGNGYTPADMAIVNDQFYFTNASRTLFKYDGTGSTGVVNIRQFNKYLIMNIVEFNGRLYLGCRDAQNLNKCVLKVFDGSTDYDLYTWDNTSTSNSSFDVMVAFNGKLYWNIVGYTSKGSIYSFDGQNIVEELVLDSTRNGLNAAYYSWLPTDLTFNGFHDAVIVNGLLYIVGTYNSKPVLGSTASSINIFATNGSFWYQSFVRYANSDPQTATLVTNNNKYLEAISPTSPWNSFYNTLTQYSYSAYQNTGKITSSIIDMDLFSLDKQVNQMEVYHSALPLGSYVKNTLFFYADNATNNATATVTNTNVGSNLTVLKIPNTYPIAKKFNYEVQLSAGNSATPIVTDVVLRYVLNPTYKKVWTFDVIVVDNLELQDGSKETRTSTQIRKDLETAASKGTVPFQDVDGTVFDNTLLPNTNFGVIIKDVQFKGPYDFASDRPEYVATITMTEA